MTPTQVISHLAPATTAAAHFAARLSFETDPEDVAGALAAGGDPGFVVLDARGPAAFAAGHIPGAVNLPRPFSARDLDALGERMVVTYCWGPGCNGATRAAAELAALGRQVKEMIGGFEYWVRAGHPVDGHDARLGEAADQLGVVKLRGAVSCLC